MAEPGFHAPPRTSTRPAGFGDAEAIARVHVASWRETYPGLVPQPMLDRLSVAGRTRSWRSTLRRPPAVSRTAVFVAEWNRIIVGFAAGGAQRSSALRRAGFTAEIDAIYVLRAAQGQGLGRLLMASLAQTFVDRGHGAASLWVLRENAAARRFYERLGGEPVAEKQDGALIEIAYGWSALTRLLG